MDSASHEFYPIFLEKKKRKAKHDKIIEFYIEIVVSENIKISCKRKGEEKVETLPPCNNFGDKKCSMFVG